MKGRFRQAKIRVIVVAFGRSGVKNFPVKSDRGFKVGHFEADVWAEFHHKLR
jgi:hypothetical protein